MTDSAPTDPARTRQLGMLLLADDLGYRRPGGRVLRLGDRIPKAVREAYDRQHAHEPRRQGLNDQAKEERNAQTMTDTAPPQVVFSENGQTPGNDDPAAPAAETERPPSWWRDGMYFCRYRLALGCTFGPKETLPGIAYHERGKHPRVELTACPLCGDELGTPAGRGNHLAGATHGISASTYRRWKLDAEQIQKALAGQAEAEEEAARPPQEAAPAAQPAAADQDAMAVDAAVLLDALCARLALLSSQAAQLSQEFLAFRTQASAKLGQEDDAARIALIREILGT